jgi:hypothetical protein
MAWNVRTGRYNEITCGEYPSRTAGNDWPTRMTMSLTGWWRTVDSQSRRSEL